jgi:hypothetical protein
MITRPTQGSILARAAIGWSVLVVIGTAWLPIETVDTGRPGVQPRYSLVHQHGYGVLLPAGIPLLTCLIVALLLSRRPNRTELSCAWLLSSALTLAAIAGTVTFLIGVFVLPAGALLMAAAAVARPTSGAMNTELRS